MRTSTIPLLVLAIVLAACQGKDTRMLQHSTAVAKAQIKNQIEVLESDSVLLEPLTLDKEGALRKGKPSDWRSGFFPGCLWYLYELTEDHDLREAAMRYTGLLQEAKFLTSHHDIGFIINSSYGNALRLTADKSYEEVITTAARSLLTRFRENAGIIQSWNATRGWDCPVIIDNMMNLELLFRAYLISHDQRFYDVAVSHADRTLREHFRPDGSTFHVVDYDTLTGEVKGRYTAQGYADGSTWSRGQCWGIYGFTMAYRFTRDQRYLDQAEKAFRLIWNHPELPEDRIPYWDMDVPKEADTPRDASSAAILSSALYEMSTMPVQDPGLCKKAADQILRSLSTPQYLAMEGENMNFILMHSVSSKPANQEVDVPLIYADYYFLEAMTRKIRIERGQALD